MAVDALLAALERAAKADAEARLEAVRARAAEVTASAETVAARRIAEAEEKLLAEERALIQRDTAAVAREWKEQRLTARATVLDRVFSLAAEQLTALPVSRYTGQVTALCDEALAYLEGRPATLSARPEVAAILALHVQGQALVTVAADPASAPGVVARTDDGEVTVDNGLAARLGRQRPDLAIEVGRLVEGAEG